MKIGTQNVLFVAAFAALFTGCPPPSNMMTDTGVMPPDDGGMPDSYVPPDEDGGTPDEDSGMDDPDTGVPGVCSPDEIAAGTPGCTSCECDMPTDLAVACSERPETCRTGVGLRNTCGMTTDTNRCGFDLPLEGGSTGNVTPYVGGFSSTCNNMLDRTRWVGAAGPPFDVDVMTINGQYTMLWGSGGLWGQTFVCHRVGGLDTCTSNASNADMSSELNARVTFASDCLSGHLEIFNGTDLMTEGTVSFSSFR